MPSFILRNDCCRSLHFPAVLYLFNHWPKPSWNSFLEDCNTFLPSGTPKYHWHSNEVSLSYLNHNALIPLNEGPPLFLSSLHLRQITEVNIRHLLRPLDSTQNKKVLCSCCGSWQSLENNTVKHHIYCMNLFVSSWTHSNSLEANSWESCCSRPPNSG